MSSKRIIVYEILLSALLYSVSFYFLHSLGFLVIPALILLFHVQYNSSSSLPYYSAFLGLIWGVGVYGSHFTWLYALLTTKSDASQILSIGLYLFIVTYMAATSSLWFWCVHKALSLCKGVLSRVITMVLLLVGYFIMLENFTLVFCGRLEGYSFISPLIPLSTYKIFLRLFIVMTSFIKDYQTRIQVPKKLAVRHIKPVTQGEENNFSQCCFKLHQQLVCEKQREDFFCLGAESLFKYPLNKIKEVQDLWCFGLTQGQQVILGGHFEDKGEKLYQAVYWMDSRGIRNTHLKRHVVPFVEKMPTFLKKCTILERMFLCSKKEFCANKTGKQLTIFEVDKDLTVVPQICSEFFFATRIKQFWDVKRKKPKAQILFFVNDSWFISHFKIIIKQLALLKSVLIGMPVWYIGHTDAEELTTPLNKRGVA